MGSSDVPDVVAAREAGSLQGDGGAALTSHDTSRHIPRSISSDSHSAHLSQPPIAHPHSDESLTTRFDYYGVESVIGYHSMPGMFLDLNMEQQFVNPAQIISGNVDVVNAGQYAPSPSNEELRSSSSTASPEPLSGNGLSTIPGGSVLMQQSLPRSIAPSRRPQDTKGKNKSVAGVAPRSVPGTGSGTSSRKTSSVSGVEAAGPSSSPSNTPNEEGEGSVTVCTNCSTATTPLWRRDHDGQPLCKRTNTSLLSVILINAVHPGNACGLFFVGTHSLSSGWHSFHFYTETARRESSTCPANRCHKEEVSVGYSRSGFLLNMMFQKPAAWRRGSWDYH